MIERYNITFTITSLSRDAENFDDFGAHLISGRFEYSGCLRRLLLLGKVSWWHHRRHSARRKKCLSNNKFLCWLSDRLACHFIAYQPHTLRRKSRFWDVGEYLEFNLGKYSKGSSRTLVCWLTNILNRLKCYVSMEYDIQSAVY